MTTNIFKEHIGTFTSERITGHQQCKTGSVLIAGFAAAARLAMISGNFVSLQHIGKYRIYPKHRKMTFLLQTKESYESY